MPPFGPPHAGIEPPPLGHLEPEYRPHFEAWKADPSPAHGGRLLAAVAPALEHGLKAYGGARPGPLVRSRARRIALDALGAYDPMKGPLRPHLLTHLQGLQRYAAQQGQMISVPARVAMDRARLDEAERHLEDVHGRSPSDLELADHTGLGLERMAHVRRYRPGFAEAETARPGDDGDDEEGGDAAVERPDPLRARVALIYHDLDPVNQAIVDHGFGLHGRPKLRAIDVARKMNLTPGAISQRAARIQAMLDAVEDAGVL